MHSVRLLDCTLRDGGYVNNWEFDTRKANTIIDGLYRAGVRIIEVGIAAQKTVPGKQTAFRHFDEITPLLQNKQSDALYALMMNVADIEQYDVPNRGNDTVDCIRLAFFKDECDKAIYYASQLKEKGYLVFLQTMASFMYSEEELFELIDKVNTLQPYAFYMVDSFGTMFNQETHDMAEMIDSRLKENIAFGFHAHNNMQMAFSNTMEFLRTVKRHDAIADSSIYGMGRGAGNVPTELLMDYLNHPMGNEYDIKEVERLFDQEIRPIFQQYYWGYSMEYFATARYKANSAYGWWLSQKGITDAYTVDKIMSRLPAEARHKLHKSLIDEIIQALKDQ